MKLHLLTDTLSRDIISLLTVSNLSSIEKKVWLKMLPDMDFDEKDALKKNLEEEVMYATEMSKEAVGQFIAALDKGL